MFNALCALASRQHGVLTVDELRGLGFSLDRIRTLARRGMLERRRRGVYVVAAVPPSWEQAVLVAVRAAGRGAVAAGLTALRLWGLARWPTGIEVVIPVARSVVLDGVVVHRTTKVDPADFTTTRGIPVTSVSRTLLDLSGRIDARSLGKWADEAQRQGLVRLPQLVMCRERFGPGRSRHLPRVDDVVAKRDERVGPGVNDFEKSWMATIVAAGFEPPEQNARVLAGGRLWEVDYWFGVAGAGVEAQGWDVRRMRTKFDSDANKARAFLAAGYEVLPVTSTTEPARLFAELATVLIRRGFPDLAPQSLGGTRPTPG